MVSRSAFDKELKELQHHILKMGSKVERVLKNSILSLVEKDIAIAQEIINSDYIINNMEFEIQDKSVKIVATQQPIAKDLRRVCTAMKIITDLERIGDHAVDISKINIKLINQEYIKPLIDIPRMAELAESMLKDALDAYVKEDIELAQEACKKDDEIDGIYNQIFRELLVIMMEKPGTISQATYFLFIAKYLERVADHATNICEWVIYLVTGERKDLNR